MPPQPLPYNLHIGVTGHRKLADPEAVRIAVEKLLKQLDETFAAAARFPRGKAGAPRSWAKFFDGLLCGGTKLIWQSLPVTSQSVAEEHLTPLHWTVVSPIAKGADRIVAEAVLSQPHGQLHVISPFAKLDYERDFVEKDDLDQFRNLWERAAETHELSHTSSEILPTDGDTEKASKQATRNAGYFDVGCKVVDGCEILIAVWDGKPAAGYGGTGDIVKYAVDQGRLVFWIDAKNPAGEPHLIIRKESEKDSPSPLPEMTAKSIPSRAKELSNSFHKLAAYNRDTAFEQSAFDTILERNTKGLQKAAKEAELPDEVLAPILKNLLPYYARADQLAIRYQQLYAFSAVWLYRLAAAAVSIVVVQVGFFPNALWLISFEIAAMIMAVLLLRIGTSEAWHEKWLHDRHLAEQIRIAMFTSLIKLDDDKAEDGGQVLPFYRGPEGWVSDAFASIMQNSDATPRVAAEFHALKRFLIDGWIVDQQKYHARNAKRKGDAAHSAHRTGLFLFSTTLVMACLHLFGVGHGGHGSHDEQASLLISNAITALAIALPAWGAAIHAINVLLERERIAKRSEQMAKVLKRIAKQAEEAQDLEQLRPSIKAARNLMATENLEWWISLSFRELVLPV